MPLALCGEILELKIGILKSGLTLEYLRKGGKKGG